MNATQRGPLRLLVLFFILLAVCIGVTYLSVRVMTSDRRPHERRDGYDWVKSELAFTAEEAERIEALEGPYRAELRRLQAEFDRRVGALAEILESSDSYSPEVTAAVHAIHAVHGQLQQLSIEHYFDMLRELPEEKQARLRSLAVEALSKPQ